MQRVRLTTLALLGAGFCGLLATEQVDAQAPVVPALPAGAHMVCLGDSITDGGTYPQIILQALKEAKKPAPTMIGAGIVCDTIPLMANRLQQCVLALQPRLVTVLAGANDGLHGEDVAIYEQGLRDIITRVQAAGGRVIICTPCILNQGNSLTPNPAEAILQQYITAIRKVARDTGSAVAENYALQSQARADGKQVISADGVHPNYLGQSLIARSILDAMGYMDVPLPTTFRPRLFPGLIIHWQMRLTPTDAVTNKPMVLDEKSIGTLKVDAEWKTYTLPDKPALDPATKQPVGPDVWDEQMRENGFATNIATVIGKGPVQAMALVNRKKAGTVYLNLGGDEFAGLWVNGKKIEITPKDDHGNGRIAGFHAGRTRVAVPLQAGKNTLVVENPGSYFFISVSDQLVWEEEYCKKYK